MTFNLKQITPQLLVFDLERAISFYVEQLGFTVAFRYEDFYAGIENAGHAIHLKKDTDASEHKLGQRPNENLDLIFSVDNLATLFEEISAKEVEIVQPLRQMPYGAEFYIADPDRHVIAFMEG